MTETTMMTGRVFKVILVGDAGVGKDKFLQRHIQEPFDQPMDEEYVCTMGVHVVPLTFQTTTTNDRCGRIEFNVWHTNGIEVRLFLTCVIF